MVAGALLLFALTGIVALLLQGFSSGRQGEVAATASNAATALLAEVQGSGFEALSAAGVGVFDAGPYTDTSGRRYGRIVRVTGGDGGYPEFNVQVDVEYSSSEPPPYRRQLRTSVNMVISRTPDAN
jgi:hypothetical protein